jgi:hypothetical protein
MPSFVARDSAPNATMQRRLDVYKPKDASDKSVSTLHGMAVKLHDATANAYNHVLGSLRKSANPMSGYTLSIKDFSSTAERFAHWVGTLAKGNSALKAAATGYMIEDAVTAAFKSATGYEAQYVTSDARPDFRIEDDKHNAGLVDITSSGEEGHILDKRFSKASFKYLAECTYPSIDFSNYTAVKLDPKDADALNQIRVARAGYFLHSNLLTLQNNLKMIESSGRGAEVSAAAEAAEKAVKPIRMSAVASTRPTDVTMKDVDAKINKLKGLLGKDGQSLNTVSDIYAWTSTKYEL